ncbi:MAG: hypothetical protein F6K54_29870 [Okeania sp. SIO3B5]|uniref:hypothetical protein n=1 Tax=Okeania sp. SIO3B5 TaxID=2607811 RepID=UPI001400A750|nr:hypothetical protein [Okeania sp. SIO3B5]NEO56912.1 hypothetical protein [Okeania sp. SIO3B5]
MSGGKILKARELQRTEGCALPDEEWMKFTRSEYKQRVIEARHSLLTNPASFGLVDSLDSLSTAWRKALLFKDIADTLLWQYFYNNCSDGEVDIIALPSSNYILIKKA